jgi:hypothetical protein
MNDPLWALVELVFCYGVLQATSWLFLHFTLTRPHSRKLIHVATGPIHMAFWPLFGSSQSSALWSSVTPLVLTLRLVLIGFGWDDARLRMSMARSGKGDEFWRGPLVYGMAHVVVTWLYKGTKFGVLLCKTVSDYHLC